MKITDISNLNLKKTQDVQNKVNTIKNDTNTKVNDEYKNGKINENSRYNNLKLNIDEKMISEVMAETEKAKGLIQDLLSGMLSRQMGISEDTGFSIDDLIEKYSDKIRSGGSENLTIDEIARKEAEELIGPGGEWSPENVSSRIVDFSIGIFGGDKSKIGIIKDAINRGFGEAEKAWGDTLPDITNKTRVLIDEKLDNWVNGESQKTVDE